jgi:hypothetical protein
MGGSRKLAAGEAYDNKCSGMKMLGNARVEVFMAVTMRSVVFWDIKTQLVLHRRHITSQL